MNSVAQALTGWAGDALGQPIEEVFRIAGDQSGQPVQSDLSRVIHQGASCDLADDVVLLVRNGAPTPIEGSAAPIRGEHGELFGAVVVFRDSTERRRADHAIWESERREKDRSSRLRLLWEATTVMLCSAEPDAMLRELFANIGPHFGLDKHRILVVDDSRDAAMSLAIMLRLAGHETCTAFDGVEAIQTAAGFRPDVVLLDIGLPKMNGYEVARQIRKQPWGGATVLIALTGWGQDEDKRRALEAGFDHHLTKPGEARALEKLLESMKPVHADEDPS